MPCSCEYIKPCCGCTDTDCSCPPDYNIDPASIQCADGTQCDGALCTDCVFLCEADKNKLFALGGCYGFSANDSLTTIITKINNYCPSSYNAVNNILFAIANNTALGTIFCELVANCTGGSYTGTVPVIVSVIWP